MAVTIRYLLDTNIYIAKKRPLEIYQRFSELKKGDIGMSLITLGELQFGVQKSQHRDIALEKLTQLTQYIFVVIPTPQTAEQYAIIRNFLEKK